MSNLLEAETSPYLLQHKDNPVAWMPWGEAAFERARAEDKPIFLSVGYSSCHWCHVMAHESFEDDEVASVLDRGYVSVKVDREERPDVDEAYMTAVQLQSGRGGWPMSVFMSPDGAPFFAGTYFPKDDRNGHPGFLTILRQLDAMWRGQRDKVLEAASEFRRSLEETIRQPAPKAFRSLDWEFVEEAFQRIAADFDPAHGGFGGAPKFPPHSAIELCLALSQAAPLNQSMRERAQEMALFSLERMCLGGLQDHVGGGFHRYSTDGLWLLPHFEKMLYDNALMLRNLALALPLADSNRARLFASARDGIVRWLGDEMRSPEGLLCSAYDADSEGEEGKFYVWTVQEVRDLLGSSADDFLSAYSFESEGNFRDEATGRRTGANIPFRKSSDGPSFEAELAVLREARHQRTPPMRDDKALVGWNGLAVAGLAAAGQDSLADELLRTLTGLLRESGRLPHQVAAGKASGEAFLEDVAGLLFAMVVAKLDEAPKYLHLAQPFLDGPNGGYFATSDQHELLFGRSKPMFDQPIPSSNALLARVFVRTARLDEAWRTVEAGMGWIERAPGATEALLLAAVELLLASEADPRATTPAYELRPGEIVGVSLRPEVWPVGKDGWASGEVVLAIREGYHINSHKPPARWLKPTAVEIESAEAEMLYPPDVDGRYEGTVSIPVRIRGEGNLELTVRCQPCSEEACLEEVVRTLEIRTGA